MKEVSGVFKLCSLLLTPQKERVLPSSLCSSSSRLCDISDVEIFPLILKPSVTERVQAHLSMHSSAWTTIQCISINVKGCVFTSSVWPLIFIQPHSAQSLLIASFQNPASQYVKSHWLYFSLSLGTPNIAFRFLSRAGRASAGINSDILQWCVMFVCVSQRLSYFHLLICTHGTSAGTIKGLYV